MSTVPFKPSLTNEEMTTPQEEGGGGRTNTTASTLSDEPNIADKEQEFFLKKPKPSNDTASTMLTVTGESMTDSGCYQTLVDRSKNLQFLADSDGKHLAPYERPEDLVAMDVFLSYHEIDNPSAKLVNQIAEVLSTHFKKTVFFNGGQPGQNKFRSDLHNALYSSRVFLIFLSYRFLESETCVREANTAIQRFNNGEELQIIPVFYTFDSRFGSLTSFFS